MTELLKVNNLIKEYKIKLTNQIWQKKSIFPVNDVSFIVTSGRNLGIAGESGSGKTTLSRLIGGLEKPTSGEILIKGQNINQLTKKGNKVQHIVQYVFQELYETLNPKFSILQTLIEPLDIFKVGSKKQKKELVLKKLQQVGLAESILASYPFELSGGQRQRVAIARAIMMQPQLIIADEPVSALDLSIRAQIINLFLQLGIELTYIIISHDLNILRYMCQEIIIYYAGQIVEYNSDAQNFFKIGGRHPYSKRLIAASKGDDLYEQIQVIDSANINLLALNYTGCRYYNFCPNRKDKCSTQNPSLREYNNSQISCFYPD